MTTDSSTTPRDIERYINPLKNFLPETDYDYITSDRFTITDCIWNILHDKQVIVFDYNGQVIITKSITERIVYTSIQEYRLNNPRGYIENDRGYVIICYPLNYNN